MSDKKYKDSVVVVDDHEYHVRRKNDVTTITHMRYSFWNWEGIDRHPESTKFTIGENPSDEDAMMFIKIYNRGIEAGKRFGISEAQSKMRDALGLYEILDDIRDEIRFLKNK